MDQALAAIKGGLALTLVGLAIVFIVQTLITTVVTLMRRLDEGWHAEEKEAAKTTATAEEATIDNTTLVLLTATITTVLQGRAFAIRRVRRLLPGEDRHHGGWKASGRAALHGSHYVRRGR